MLKANNSLLKVIVDRRKHLDWTQRDLAEKSGINFHTITAFEKRRGARGIGFNSAVKLLLALGIKKITLEGLTDA